MCYVLQYGVLWEFWPAMIDISCASVHMHDIMSWEPLQLHIALITAPPLHNNICKYSKY